VSKPTQQVERLRIEGFAGIQDLDMTIRPFTVLIGPQSVGKSIVAKLLFLFRGTPRSLFLEALKDSDLTATESFLERFTDALPSPTHSTGAARVVYSTGDLDFILEHAAGERGDWKVRIPAGLRKAFKTLAMELEEEQDDAEQIVEANQAAKTAYQERVEELWPGANTPPRFVPAGRAFFSQIERVDPFIAEFWRVLSSLRARRRLRTYLPSTEAAAHLSKQLLSGKYAREGLAEFIHSVDGRKLPPRLWSSGQQEAQPLVLLLQRYCEGFFDPTSLFIEEPEAHLFPNSQRWITELIALAFNARQPGMRVFITTHSPYILTTLNNLLLAGQLYARKLTNSRLVALGKIVPRDRSLAKDLVSACYMDRRMCRPILDDEAELIGASAIDTVSEKLNQQFDELLELDRA
jgi:hypothetical protein